MEKFHYFLYGKESTLETDQKPLVSIYKKHMVDISPRVQRLIVRSFPYQPFNVIYKKGKDIPVADALSRVTPMDPEDNIQLPIMCKVLYLAFGWYVLVFLISFAIVPEVLISLVVHKYISCDFGGML